MPQASHDKLLAYTDFSWLLATSLIVGYPDPARLLLRFGRLGAFSEGSPRQATGSSRKRGPNCGGSHPSPFGDVRHSWLSIEGCL